MRAAYYGHLMRLLGVLVLLSSCSCPRAKAPEWPEYPATDAARSALIKQWTQRPVTQSPEVTPEFVFQEAERLGWNIFSLSHRERVGVRASIQRSGCCSERSTTPQVRSTPSAVSSSPEHSPT